MSDSHQRDAEREDTRAARELGRFLPRLVTKPGVQVATSRAASGLFKMSERWTFVPSPIPSEVLTICNGTWSTPSRPDVHYESILANDGRSVSIEICKGGAEIPRSRSRAFTIHLGTPDECRTRGANMLRSLPYWEDGPPEERKDHEIGYDSFESIRPFGIKVGDLYLKCEIKGFSSWNLELGEDRNSPQATAQFQLLHQLKFHDADPIYRLFVNVNTTYTRATIDVAYVRKAGLDHTAMASLLYFVTLYYATKEFCE